jgi:hypothetical protein
MLPELVIIKTLFGRHFSRSNIAIHFEDNIEYVNLLYMS